VEAVPSALNLTQLMSFHALACWHQFVTSKAVIVHRPTHGIFRRLYLPQGLEDSAGAQRMVQHIITHFHQQLPPLLIQFKEYVSLLFQTAMLPGLAL
jgi:hypothetical protein